MTLETIAWALFIASALGLLLKNINWYYVKDKIKELKK